MQGEHARTADWADHVELALRTAAARIVGGSGAQTARPGAQGPSVIAFKQHNLSLSFPSTPWQATAKLDMGMQPRAEGEQQHLRLDAGPG